MAISQENKKLLTNTVIAVIVVVAANKIVIKPLLQFLGIKKSDAEIAKEKSDAENINEIEKNLNARGLSLSKSKAEWDQIADTIYNDLRYSNLDDNKADAGYQIARVQNDADIIYLIKTFGKRQEYFLFLPTGSPKGLTEFITSNLTRDTMNLINANYKSKGIKFRF
jgi:hypothetical protein